jgi:hypothetical protein
MIEYLEYFVNDLFETVWLSGYYKEDDITTEPVFWGEEYGIEFPAYADTTGNLCTSIYEEVDEDVARVFVGFKDAPFDTAAAAITVDTAAEDLPANVARIMALFDADAYAALFTEDGIFSTYYEFLSAAAQTPSFCAGTIGGMYSRFSAELMCAKELAAFLATVISYTGSNNSELVDDNDDAVPLMNQGLLVTEDPLCVGEDSDATTVALATDYC